MSKVNQLKNKARREEQRENWSRAIEFYTQALDASRQQDEAFADLSLYNRIGDIYLRIGQKNTAVRYYEQAIERYSEQDLHTSAIALCNKVLRILPERSTVFLQLGRLHLATNLIADARTHYHGYAEAMRARGGGAAAYDALEELIGRTGDRTTLSLWVSWLAAEEDPEVATTRVTEARDALSRHGVDADEVLEKIRTGDTSGFVAEQAEVAHEDPLANAFLSVPEHYAAARGASPQSDVVPEAAEDPESKVGPEEEEAREAVLEGMHTIAEDLELGSVPWQDEFEPSAAADPGGVEELEIAGPERLEARAVGGPDDIDPEDGMSTLSEALEYADDDIATVDFLEPTTLEALETPSIDNEGLADESSVEILEGEGTPPADFDRDLGFDTTEADALDSPALDSATASLELAEAHDAIERVGALAPKTLHADEIELSSSYGSLDAEITSGSAFQLEPLVTDVPLPEPEGAEPPEPPLSATMVAGVPSPLDGLEERDDRLDGPDWAPSADLPETPGADALDGVELDPPSPTLDAIEPSTPEADGWVGDAEQAIDRVATAAAEQAAAEAAAVEQAAAEAVAAEQAAAEAAAAEQAAVEAAAAEQAAAEAAAAEQAAVEAAAAEQAAAEEAAAAEQAAAEAAAAEQAAAEAAAAEQAAAEAVAAEEAAAEAAAAEQAVAEAVAAEQAAAEAAAAEQAAAEAVAAEQAAAEAAAAEEAATETQVNPDSIESETIAVELPFQEPAEAPPVADPAYTKPSPASVPEREAEDISMPLAEPRLQTEDPELAFSEWVASASQGVLRRALPELEERHEDQKALLVVHRLSNLEDHDVEFRRKYVDALQDLARIEEATEACLVLAAGLEALGRPTEARQAYARVMDLTPGDPRGQQGFDRLEGAVEAEVNVHEDAERTKPYTPAHVGGRGGGPAVTPPRPANSSPRNGVFGDRQDEQARPYSGVAGGADATSDFEQLLSEFRAQLSEKPTKSDSVSRTEYGATLKGMGKLDDAIRELQAAVREPSPPALAYELLGEAFLEKGQSRIAVRLLEKALSTMGQTDREMMGVLYQLGLSYERVTDLSKALLCYERIFSVDIDYRDVQDRILTCSA